MSEYQENSVVESIERLADALYRLTLHAPCIAAAAKPGQFIMAACGHSLDPLLRRPFSIHQAATSGTIQLLFKVIGRGTNLLSELRPGQSLSLLGPLGHGFQLPPSGPLCLIGGGIGIAPLFFLATKWLQQPRPPESCVVLLGSRTAEEIRQLATDFSELGCLVGTATDDGSLGHHGLVSDLLPPFLSDLKQVCTCGPTAMMAAIAGLCRDTAVPCETSLESHMACGLGACLGCAIPGADGHYKHVCKHGPVFNAEEVAWSR
ncbi:MAG: dihydroorotate dehydrogenase electron transfer subunit [Desulfobulbaceae bacterium]|nr:dihydroorotate dehydrogenase electron transfer subunit [Desulfobulbaceae bacterium]